MPIDLSAQSREKVGTVVQLAKYYGATIKNCICFLAPSEKSRNETIKPYLNQAKIY